MIIIHSKQPMKKTMKIEWEKKLFLDLCVWKRLEFFFFLFYDEMCLRFYFVFVSFFDHDDKTMFATKNVCWVHTFIFTFTKKNIIFIDSLLIHFFFSLSIYGIA